MNKAGVMRIGAMLAVLTVLAGGFAALPYWTASAGDHKIWGLVDECGSQGPSYLPNVIVSLIDAHTGSTITNSSGGDGYYAFFPAPASYLLKFEISNHYTKTYPAVGAFRFDDTSDLNINICLEKMPTRDTTLRVLVVDEISTAHFGEDLAVKFVRTRVNGENIVPGLNLSTGIASVTRHPVVRPGYYVIWTDSIARTQFYLQEGADFAWVNFFTGVIQIRSSVVLTSLGSGSSGKWVNVTYDVSATTAKLSFFPVVPGYNVYKNASSWMGGEGTEWTLDVDTGVFTVFSNFIFGTDSLTIDYSGTGVISGATVNIYNTTRKQVVANGITDGSGTTTLSIWRSSTDLELQVQDAQHQPYAAPIDTVAVNATRVVLPSGVKVFGVAFRADGSGVVNTNVVGYLYNTNRFERAFKKLIAATVSGALYVFHAEANQGYKMVIDADGYKAAELFVSTAVPPGQAVRQNVTLAPSLKEEYRTRVTYDYPGNWNQLTFVNRSLTLRPDTTVPGLELPGVRSLALQIDYTLGNRDGNLSGTEVTSYQNWLQGRLADYVTTVGFLTTNGKAYNSTPASYIVFPPAFWPTVLAPTTIWVNTTATYTLLRTPALVNGKARYFVNVTTPNDSNETVYQDRVVDVALPRGYEMTQKKVTGTITTTGWAPVTVDAGLAPGSSTIEMTVERSRNGTARAMVGGPSGKFYVLDDTLKNYTAVVAANTNITFSAEQSTDPIGNIRDANFTWRFTNNTNPNGNKGYNITSTFNYSSSLLGVSHYFVVNLTVKEAGGNYTYRDIKVYVDDTAPIAYIKTNRTGVAVVTNSTILRIDEKVPIKWDASASTDSTYSGAPTWLEAWKNHIPDIDGSRWDYEGDHTVDSRQRVVVHAFDKPGYYNATLQVVDWVGHTSTVNATLHVIANDTTKPTPNFLILDPSKDWSVTSALVEGKSYAFNASTSTDNFDDNKNLSYAWHFPGNAICTPNCSNGGNIPATRGLGGWNVTVTWAVFNVSYNVTLNVTDRGFGPNPKGPNWANLTTSVHVAVDVSNHPDLKYVAQSLKIEPSQPEEGQSTNVSFIIENIASRADASAVTITLTAKDPNGAVVPVNGAGTPHWYDANWNPASNTTIASGKRVHIVFTISFPAQGNKSIEIRFYDAREPYTWVDSQNRVTGSLFVKLAGWVVPAAIIGFIIAVIAVAFGARTWSRYRSGELVFKRKEKKEKKKLKDEGEEEEPEPEEDTKGKKRL